MKKPLTVHNRWAIRSKESGRWQYSDPIHSEESAKARADYLTNRGFEAEAIRAMISYYSDQEEGDGR